MSFLLDTDTCSAHLKFQGKLTHKFLQHMGHLHVSVITVGELYTWALRAKASAKRSQSLADLLRALQVLEVTEPVARKFGEVRSALLDSGKTVPPIDLFIAATALVYDFTLVTHNIRDFVHVPGLRIDDWLTP